MSVQPHTYSVGNQWIGREIRVDEDGPRTTAIELGPHARLPLAVQELVLVLDSSRWRFDIPHWRWTKSGAEGTVAGFHRWDCDDAGWATVPHLLPCFDALYDGYAWFRHRFVLPEEQRGQPITLVIGGLDDEDWAEYRIFLNEVLIAEHRGTGTWREPCTVRFSEEDARYSHLQFGDHNLLALEVKDLRRRLPDMVPGERDHYLFNSLLLDQFVTAGSPYTVVSDFTVTQVRADDEGGRLHRLEVEAHARMSRALAVTLTYEAEPDKPHMRKRVTIRNQGDAPVRLLDVLLDEWQGDFVVGRGGRGEPCLSDTFFLGVEHPAGVTIGEGGRLRALQLPGIDVSPGECFACAPVVVGTARSDQHMVQAFHEYLLGLRPRRDRRLTLYSALGWYDFTSLAAEPLSELSEELVHENLQLLRDLRDQGVGFDVYMLDDWWEHTDLGKFRERTFPHGGTALVEQISAAEMQPGLWFATTPAVWTCDQAPGMDAAVAAGTGAPPPMPQDAAEQPDWVELFTNFNVRDKRFCLAAEPYRSIILNVIPKHVRDLGLACLKLDCASLHCSSSEHAHRPGKYSMQAMVDVVLAAVSAAQEHNPNLAVIWYWGFRSPWWLQHGDAVFDKGLKMEAASPASSPTHTYRQGVSLNVDQAIRHATLLPLPLQDSLGVWLGNVAWANRMGKEEWRDAFLLDIARGSAIVQLWGDLSLLEQDDVTYLAAVLRWMRSSEASYRNTITVGGDPWAAEAYGYAQRSDQGVLLTLHNPSFAPATVHIDRATSGVRADEPLSVVELYPFPGEVAAESLSAAEGALAIPLLPFELRCLDVRQGNRPAGRPSMQQRPPERASRRLDLPLLETVPPIGSSATRRALHLSGSVILPEIQRGDHLALVVRLQRAGQWWYHPEPQSLVQVDAHINGLDVYCEVVPRSRSYNGPGCPWVAYDLPVGPASTGQTLAIEVRGQLPVEVEPRLEVHLYDAWWLRHAKRFAARE